MTESKSSCLAAKAQVYDSILRLSEWLGKNQYRAYDPFDGLSARYLRPLTFETKYLRMALQQGVRRFPVNLRPLFGIAKSESSKGMGFLARGFIRMHANTGDPVWRPRAEFALQWLIDHQIPGYSGACWGNHFDYQSRGGYGEKGGPTVVWSSLIGHAFLDAYSCFHENRYLDVAITICEHIVKDLGTISEKKVACIRYSPGAVDLVHNANTLGASLLARTYSYTGNKQYRDLAEPAIRFTANHQRPGGSWYYGEESNLHWIDSFHTAYVLDCFKYYAEGTGDSTFDKVLTRGYEYWKHNFFLNDGTPKYYNCKTLPLDIQCCSQAVDTLVFFHDRDPDNLSLAIKIAQWTIHHMQDRSGYFYYRRYSSWLVNKTPTLHWGQATMLSALAGLYGLLTSS